MRRDGSRPIEDRIRMMHMLDAAREAIEFAKGRKREDLDSNSMLRRALKDCVQEIGEAAANVSDPARARASQLPWPKIVGMRHRMIHVYYDINCDALWKVVADELKPLIEGLEAALKEWPQES